MVFTGAYLTGTGFLANIKGRHFNRLSHAGAPRREDILEIRIKLEAWESEAFPTNV